MDFEVARSELIDTLSTEIKDKRVLAAMRSIPREHFVPPESRHLAYEDRPLPIGYDQTISQPYIIALMTEALELRGGEKVLEVGTGSGYQAAILARLARLVITTERVPHLVERAKKHLDEINITNVEVRPAESSLGWRRLAPYDAIIVTAAAPRVPPELLSQLAIGGRMVVPVGSRHIQELCKVTKGSKKTTITNLGGCRFVALIGRGAWEEEKG
ncbi:MAG: protein-L-isoaspartate(D-aspartate) O-methyltransferase [Dehalococcoidia bacterium]